MTLVTLPIRLYREPDYIRADASLRLHFQTGEVLQAKKSIFYASTGLTLPTSREHSVVIERCFHALPKRQSTLDS